MSTVRLWSALSAVLGVIIVAAAIRLGMSEELPPYEQPAVRIALWEAGALLGIALLVLFGARRLAGNSSPDSLGRSANSLASGRPVLTLFLISFVALFIELMLIRYCNSQIRIFSFYKNVPLIGCFVGLGLGCCLAKGTSRHIGLFLVWLVPVGVFLAAGSIVVRNALGEFAAIGSSEHVLGDISPGGEPAALRVFSQLLMAGFCVGTLVVITLLFECLGRVLGEAFERVSRLRGYTVNILGSLGGILAFTGLCYLETPPWVWFLAGLLPLLWWAPGPRWIAAGLGLIALNVFAVLPEYGETVWSRYQKLVGHEVPGDGDREAYLVQISDVFYQVAVDLSPEEVDKNGNPFPHYDAVYRDIPTPERVLIVGAGTGNDVAAALRADAARVDAVDIDPAIVGMGREHHPERPYDDSRVRVIVDDARHAFREAPEDSYDLVVFGLLDSHTQLGTSSVRLDNYVFTMESLGDASRLVKPGGHIAVTAAIFQPWLRDRFETMLERTIGGPVTVSEHGLWHTFLARVPSTSAPAGRSLAASVSPATLPTDDWPFIYLPARTVPTAYLWVVACLVIASIVILWRRGLKLQSFRSQHAHFFFLGAAFLLMEVHAINRLALLFGTVWLVSAVTIAVVLLLIVAANLTVLAVKRVPYWLSYSALTLSLLVSYLVETSTILGQGTGAAIGFALLLLSPVYFAGLIFARSFKMAEFAAPAIGANILGAVLGGWMEYSTMALGMRNLVLLAGALYASSLIALLVSRRRHTSGIPDPAGPQGMIPDQTHTEETSPISNPAQAT